MDLSDEQDRYEGAAPLRIPLPPFVSDGQIGLGDVVKRMTSAVGIRPCGPCQDRAKRWNERVVFYGKSS
ncbi:MAG: hypothetical protein H6509_09800 [Bryobacterales bacterium]|nr:hypothetical protein [Bryobacterales bacterium]